MISVYSGGDFGSGFVRGIIRTGSSDIVDSHLTGTDPAMVISRTSLVSMAGGLSAHATGDDFVEGAFLASVQHLTAESMKNYQAPVSQQQEKQAKANWLSVILPIFSTTLK